MASSNITTAIVAASVGAVVALVACFIFSSFYYGSSATANIVQGNTNALPSSTPPPKVMDEIPNPEIKAADVKSVTIRTVYPGYFPAGSKCAKTYNEYFGNEDGLASSSSPCEITLTFKRDGTATRSIVVTRWDKAAKAKHEVEKTDSTGSVSSADFDAIASTLVSNQAFKDWRTGTMITVSNCSISVEHSGGTKSPMSNVGPSTTAYLPMVEAFQTLEKQVNWK